MADPTEAEMMADLQAADAAGDSALAQHIAGRIKASRGPQTVASHKPGAEVQPEITAGGMALGGIEGAGSLASSAVAYPAGLAAGAIDLARGKGVEAAKRQRGIVQEGLTYSPRTPEGQGFLGAVSRLMQPWTATADYVGKKTGEATGMPNLGEAVGEAFGAVVNPLTPFALAKGMKQQSVALPPRYEVNPSAQTLQANGVKGLTTGQMADPNSLPAILERVSADHPFGLKPQREAAKESFMRAAQDKGAAPGSVPPASTDLQGRLGDLFKQYGPVYDQFKGAQVAPDVLDNLTNAAHMPKRGIDARTAAGAKVEIENALSVLGPKPTAPAPSGLLGPNGQPIPAPPAPPMKATVGDLMKARENVREALRGAVTTQDFDRARLLGAAEDKFTGAIESALPADQRPLLQQTDRQYARLMKAATAAPSGQTSFTPGQYLRRVEQGAGARNFKTGQAGDLQDLGEAARTAFQDAPMTGVRPGILSALPWAKYWGAPVSRVLNSDAGRRFMFDPRETSVLTGAPNPLAGSMAAALERAMAAGPANSTPPLLRLHLAAAHEQGER